MTTTTLSRRATFHFEAAAALTAAHQDGQTQVREFYGTVAPYNVPGATSAGRVRVRPGAIRLPADLTRVKLVDTHTKPPQPLGYATVADPNNPAGLQMRFRAGTTQLAAQRHAECADHLVDGFSVELDNIVVRDGWLEAGDLVRVALLPDPAWTGATALAASDHPDVGHEGDADPSEPPAPAGTPPAPAGTPPAPPTTPPADPTGAPQVTQPTTPPAAAAPAGIPTGASGQPATPPATIQTLYAAMASRFTGQRMTPEMEAALQHITQTANEWTEPQQYAGELWSGVGYRRRFVGLVNRAQLTNYKVVGWRWATKPVVAPYAGDKAPVPSNAAVTELVETEAERLAGAHNIDRKYRDFGQTAFFESYYRAMTESYAMLSDQGLAADLVAGATDIGGVAATTLMGGLVEALLAYPEHAVPEWAIVGKDLLPDALAITEQNKLAYLDVQIRLTRPDGSNLEGSFPLYPASQSNGFVTVGCRPAATFYELGDGTPIRVEAVDMVNAGVDPGVFGYTALVINDDSALIKKAVTP